MEITHAFYFLDMLGTAAFAVSGAMVAVSKHNDIFGVQLLALVTALGGGMMRDIILGQMPPRLFQNWTGITISFVSALAVFVAVRYWREFYDRERPMVDKINNIADALGLGSFAVTGCQVAAYAGFDNNAFLSIAMGTLTGVGGGMLRDIILNEMPFILTKHVYASAAMAGAGLYYILFRYWHGEDAFAMLIAIFLTFSLRMLATKYRWRLPRA